jgi:hypothetical protein
MSDDENPRLKSTTQESRDADGAGAGGDEITLEQSPGQAYVIFIEMNNLANKLKLLNYEDEYLIKWKMKPLSK